MAFVLFVIGLVDGDEHLVFTHCGEKEAVLMKLKFIKITARDNLIFVYLQKNPQTLNCTSTLYRSRDANDIGIQPTAEFLELLKIHQG